MNETHFPLSYRWFIAKGLIEWEPWCFSDTAETINEQPDMIANEFAAKAFKKETGADFDVYLFARRQDRDDYAFFAVTDGVIEDKVVTIHLSFVDKFELKSPLRHTDLKQSFTEWVRNVAVPDVADWMTEEDLYAN